MGIVILNVVFAAVVVGGILLLLGRAIRDGGEPATLVQQRRRATSGVQVRTQTPARTRSASPSTRPHRGTASSLS